MIQLLSFQEDTFGKGISKPALTKLPVSNLVHSSTIVKGVCIADLHAKMELLFGN